MRYYVEEPLYNFQFWGGAKENANLLTLQELEQIELRNFWVTKTRKNFAKKEKITNKNRYHCTAPTPGAVARAKKRK